jgi:hypothetical protein
MDNPETFKNGQFRDIQEWTIQRHSRMDNPETFKNGQSRDIQEWTIQRHSRMDNPETQSMLDTRYRSNNKNTHNTKK